MLQYFASEKIQFLFLGDDPVNYNNKNASTRKNYISLYENILKLFVVVVRLRIKRTFENRIRNRE
jgi:hypothetical protein